MTKKVLLGMSGGVDSSVAALILHRMGYDVTGVTLNLRTPELMGEDLPQSRCSPSDIADAQAVASFLGIPHLVLDFTRRFESAVVGRFAEEYLSGRTPNPCIFCNRELKFGAMLAYAEEHGFDFISTGHYAEIRKNAAGRWTLRRSPNGKDQSYVLYFLSQYQLAHTLMPLSLYDKAEVRRLAREAALPVAEKPDSQDICFIKGRDYAAFLEAYTGKPFSPGDFVDAEGAVLGRHKGIPHYTIGQRRGIGLSFPEPRYVIGIDAAENRVILGKEGSQYASALLAGDLNFIPFEQPNGPFPAEVKIRYQASPAPAMITPLGDGQARVDFSVPQRSVTPGQAVVFYDGDELIGGGTIREALS